MSEEIWKLVVGYKWRYEVSSLGRVRDRQTGVILPQRKGQQGYLTVRLTDGLGSRTCHVHRIVLCSFSGLPRRKLSGCHNDGNPANNASSNLRWDNQRGNVEDQRRHGTMAIGSKSGRSKLDEARVSTIRALLRINRTHSSIAGLYGVSRGTITRIAQNLQWRHVQ